MGMLLAWTVSTATSGALFEGLCVALALLSIQQVVGLVPLNSAPLECVGPALVGTLIDKHAFAG